MRIALSLLFEKAKFKARRLLQASPQESASAATRSQTLSQPASQLTTRPTFQPTSSPPTSTDSDTPRCCRVYKSGFGTMPMTSSKLAKTDQSVREVLTSWTLIYTHLFTVELGSRRNRGVGLRNI
ncbi:hypothetical protein BHE90_016590 [Fusarium euwallaceae]|uniref:Uncharacterized protein n=1 Tax=Fusarium euwallaceae TaxID=1147111 RepID=A0A430KZZ2_9HYPO|nr:hypothetical protein BHE90_016590 [Fusarium euwallaceae]